MLITPISHNPGTVFEPNRFVLFSSLSLSSFVCLYHKMGAGMATCWRVTGANRPPSLYAAQQTRPSLHTLARNIHPHQQQPSLLPSPPLPMDSGEPKERMRIAVCLMTPCSTLMRRWHDPAGPMLQLPILRVPRRTGT